MGKLSWRDILDQKASSKNRVRPKHHYQPISQICSDAQRRLAAIEYSRNFADDQLFRFRDGNLQRLWGFRVNEVFHVLWWDPSHRVCPSEG